MQGSRPAGVWNAIAPLLGYVVLFAILYQPWLTQAAEVLPRYSSLADSRLLTWVLWWVHTALFSDPGSLFDAPVFFPQPNQLTGSDHLLSFQILFAPIFATSGNAVLAANLTVWAAAYPLSAFAMNRLLVSLGLGGWAAWFGGLSLALGPVQPYPSFHLLHKIPGFLAWVAWALVRLREAPTTPRAVHFLVALLLGLLSSYYTAAMVLVVVGVCGLYELARPSRERKRFLRFFVAASGIALAAFAMMTLPYLARDELGAVNIRSFEALMEMKAAFVSRILTRPSDFAGGPMQLALAMIGVLGLLRPELRHATILGILFWMAGCGLVVAGAIQPSPVWFLPDFLHELHLFVARFFRIWSRWVVLSGFGAAVLAGVAVEFLRRFVPMRAVPLAVLVLSASLVWARGRVVWNAPRFHRVQIVTEEAAAYEAIAQVIDREGPGPLMEVPIPRNSTALQMFASQSMLGTIVHGQPLIYGYRGGYEPAEAAEVRAHLGKLPSGSAMRALIEGTNLRWLLVRPLSGRRESAWSKRLQARKSEGLVEEIVEIGEWRLVRLPSVERLAEPRRDPG